MEFSSYPNLISIVQLKETHLVVILSLYLFGDTCPDAVSLLTVNFLLYFLPHLNCVEENVYPVATK